MQQTVTVYRGDGTRRVLPGCQFILNRRQDVDLMGRHLKPRFSLIVKGAQDLRPGDRIMEGIGPEQFDWDAFVPENVENLVSVGYVQPFYWQGKVCHTEAGGFYDRY